MRSRGRPDRSAWAGGVFSSVDHVAIGEAGIHLLDAGRRHSHGDGDAQAIDVSDQIARKRLLVERCQVGARRVAIGQMKLSGTAQRTTAG
jgi:hypothetical protein